MLALNGIMKIAHLTTVHTRSDTRIFRKMCRSLAAAGHDVTLLVADGLGDGLIDGVRIIDVGRPSGRLARACWATARMWWLALRTRPDILHFHDPELIPGGLVVRLAGWRVVYDIHEYYRVHLRATASLPRPVSAMLANVYGAAERWAALVLDACVVCAPNMQHVLPLRRSILMENYPLAKEFRPGPMPAAERPTRVCCVGILSTIRCVSEMVDAAATAGATLALAGKWYPESLRTEVVARPGWAGVEELGYIDRQQIQELFDASRAGLLILDLHQDEVHVSSNKLFEYMAAGLPVIVSDIGFARDIIGRHGCGLLVSPSNDASALAAAVGWILAHPEEADRMGRAGRRAIETGYSWDQQMPSLLALYESLR